MAGKTTPGSLALVGGGEFDARIDPCQFLGRRFHGGHAHLLTMLGMLVAIVGLVVQARSSASS